MHDMQDPRPSGPEPWGDLGEPLLRRLAEQVRHDAMALGIVGPKRQRPDQLLHARGWTAPRLLAWLGSELSQLEWFVQGRRRGVAIGEHPTRSASVPFGDRRHLLVRSLPGCPDHRRWWMLLLARDDPPFSVGEIRTAGLLLRAWLVGFDHVAEPGMGRLLMGHDDRLLHADPETDLRFLQYPEVHRQLLGLFHPVVGQRWPDPGDHQAHDFVIDLAGAACWVRFKRRRAVDAPDAEHWYIELRNLDPDDLPPVGQVDDERVAHALGFLHDRFEQAPTLAQVSRAVHTSPFHFHRLFTRVIGLSPKHYLQQKQLQVAKWLLRSTRTPIGSIATQTGFASHGHFTSTFHRAIGVSPSQYRDGA